MVKKIRRIASGKTGNLGAMIVGAIVGIYFWRRGLQTILGGTASQTVFQTGSYILDLNDTLNLIIGFLIMWFGGRMHSLVRWFGIGWFMAVLGFEIAEFEVTMG